MTTVIGQMQVEGNGKMVRPENSNSRNFAAAVINVVLLVTVAAGAFYAIAPVVA